VTLGERALGNPVSRRTRSKTKEGRQSLPSVRRYERVKLYSAAVLLLVLILAGVYYWPAGSIGQADLLVPEPLNFQDEPEPRTVEELRDEGIQVVEQLLDRHPHSVGAHRSAATLFQRLNQYEHVLPHWRKCVELDPGEVSHRLWLARALLHQGSDQEAEAVLEEAAEAGLKSADLMHLLAMSRQRLGKLVEGEAIACEGVAAYPEHVELRLTHGQTHLLLGKLEDARLSFEAVLARQPNSMAARTALVQIYNRLGRLDDAKKHQAVVVKEKDAYLRDRLPFDEEYHQSLRHIVSAVLSAAAVEYHAQGDSEEAERLCRRAYAITPTCSDAYRQLAIVYRARGALLAALAVQGRLIQVEPESAANRMNYASLAFEVGRMDEGERQLQEAARLAPEDATVQSTVAEVYLRLGNASAARRYAERSVELHPTRDAYHLLATACRQQGVFDAARDAELAALRYKTEPSPSSDETP
jgi:tetratricopeptide (TPR) repeat protein